MATASEGEGRFFRILQCPLCLETLKMPKLLPCGHTYCVLCLRSHMNNKATQLGTPQASFPCPVCRSSTSPSDPTSPVDQWEEWFPVNTMVTSLLDVAVEKCDAKQCYLCCKSNKETLATCFCHDCQMLMCHNCREYHGNIPSSNHHKVTDVSVPKESADVSPDLAIIEMCPQHSDKRIEYLCSDHNLLCCNTCEFLEHRKCETVTSLSNVTKTCDINCISKEVKENIQNFNCHLNCIVSNLRENFNNIQKSKTAILQEIKSLKARLNTKLQQLEDDLIACVEAHRKSEESNLQVQEARGQSLIAAIGSDLVQLDLVMTKGTENQKVIMLHNINQNQSRYFHAISRYQEDVINVSLTIDVEENLQTFTEVLQNIGKIKVTRTKPSLPPCPEVLKKPVGLVYLHKNEPKLIPLKDSKAVKLSEINVKVSGDKYNCHVTDIAHLRDSRLIIVDRYNAKLKLFKQNDDKCTNVMVCLGQPWSMCTLANDEVAVTIPSLKTIEVLRVTDVMKKIREIKTDHHCHGIVAMRDQLLITTYEDGHFILILDLQGVKIGKIRPSNYRNENLLKPLFIKADITKGIVYVSYDSGRRLVAYGSAWDFLYTYTNEDTTGLDVDRKGNLYLCGYNSCNVQQISSDGKLINTLILKKKSNKKPLAIRFYSNMDRFIVAYGHSNILEMHDLWN
ncbi:hypothetical protein CHS0354_032214 [Potamilus streckersoni]|uniref:Uncharacterized protein n=1 Tax=Potamilus streckersoni TaxID=2493646 RepID=A0AAE0VGR5_9BIVA|nr:hypothetical protein CHS0354_032214 [Potamilus streckersoni]